MPLQPEPGLDLVADLGSAVNRIRPTVTTHRVNSPRPAGESGHRASPAHVAVARCAARLATLQPMATMLRPGSRYPLGATLVDGGANVAVHSSVAERVELCLFDETGAETRFDLHGDADVWHGFVPGLAAGQAYGFRVHGPYDPASGARCNPAKLLLDPYAKAIDRSRHLRSGGPRPRPGRSLAAQRSRLRRVRPAVPRRGPVLRLGLGDPPAPTARADRLLRGARQGVHRARSRGPRCAPRHLRRPRPPGDDRATRRPRCHDRRAAAGPSERPGGVPASPAG